MNDETYDLVVLGGGAGGVPAAIRGAGLGGRVALIEAGDLGGLCMNRGCVPFCYLGEASGILGDIDRGKGMGLNLSGTGADYASMGKQRNALIDRMRLGVKGLLKRKGVRVIQGRGRLTGRGKVEVNGETVAYRNLILATGATWIMPEFPGADLEGVMTSDGLLGEEALPARALLFGESRWLVEIGQFLRRFGSEVALAATDKNLLSGEDKAVRSRLIRVLKDQGIQIFTGAEVVKLSRKDEGLHASLRVKDKEESVTVDRFIVLNRRAALKGLGLDMVGLDGEGEFLRTNDRMETGVPGVYAIGDLTAPEQGHYSHTASVEGMIAAENAMGLDRRLNSRIIPRVLFTQPQAASVGLTRKEAKDAGYDVVVGSAPLSMNTLGMILSHSEGLVEIVSERRYGEILGVHMLGRQAGEMIGQGVLAMQLEATLEDLAGTAFPHPTLSEFLAEAAREALGRTIYIP